MKIASLEIIKQIRLHPDADQLELAEVLGFTAIVRKGAFTEGERIVFIQPDTVLPDKPWAAVYKAKSNRVRAIKLRGVWSQGIVEKLETVGLDENEARLKSGEFETGDDISGILGIVKYEPPMPQDLAAKAAFLPFQIPKTDEERFENIPTSQLPWEQPCDITLKIDGKSATYYCKLNDDKTEVAEYGVTSRSMNMKLDHDNHYTLAGRKYQIEQKLVAYCLKHKVSLALRGEVYGIGIQSMNHNPFSKVPLGLACFSVYNIDECRYERKGDPHYVFGLCEELLIPTVPLVEKAPFDVGVFRKYSELLEKMDGKPFEGVVVNSQQGSFKIINKHYDAKK